MFKKFNLDIAERLDKEDKLSKFRDLFLFPEHKNKKCLYFCGNSLGLQPKTTKDYINDELDDWAKMELMAIFKLIIHGMIITKF